MDLSRFARPTGTGNNFSEKGRAASILSLRDFLGSATRPAVFSAITGNDGQGWYADTHANGNVRTAEFRLRENPSVIEVTVTDLNSARTTSQLPASDQARVHLIAEREGTKLYRLRGSLPNLAPATTSTSSLVAEAEPPQQLATHRSQFPEPAPSQLAQSQPVQSDDSPTGITDLDLLQAAIAAPAQEAANVEYTVLPVRRLDLTEFESAVDQLFASDELLADLII